MFESILAFQALYRAKAVALTTCSGAASFEDLSAAVDRLAGRLRPHARKGAHVTVHVRPVGLHWTLLLALARLGCATSSLPAQGERPARALLDALAPDLLLTDAPGLEGGPAVLQLTPDWVSAAYQDVPAPTPACRFAPDAPARVVLSSGTTGAPKRMVLTRAVVDARIRSAGLSRLAHRRLHSRLGVDTETGFRAPLTAWATGAAVVYPDEGISGAQFLRTSRPQTLLLVPAQLQALLAELPQDFKADPDLEIVVVSGALPPSLHREVTRRLTNQVYVVYGSTEAGLVAQLSPELQGDGRTMNGVVSPSAEVEIAGPDGRALPAGETGLVRVRTEEMVDGYSGDLELTRRHFQNGWFYPGDLGVLDGEGGLTIYGREAEILDLGGLRLAPDQVETLILQCPGVRDAAAFSLADEHGVHRAHAAVVGQGEPSLQAAAALLAAELPQVSVTLHASTAIPRSDRGKIMRQDLVALYATPAEGAGLNEDESS